MIHLQKFNEGIFGFGKKKPKDDDADMFYHMFLATKIHRYAKNRIDYTPIVDNKILSDIADMIRTQFKDLYKLTVGGINKLYNKGEVYVEVCKERGGNRKFCFKSDDLFIFRIFIDNKGKECVAFKVNKKFVLEFVENKDKSFSVLPSAPPVEDKFSGKKVTTDELRQLMLKIKDKNKNKK